MKESVKSRLYVAVIKLVHTITRASPSRNMAVTARAPTKPEMAGIPMAPPLPLPLSAPPDVELEFPEIG
jgi:hypothetical protein